MLVDHAATPRGDTAQRASRVSAHGGLSTHRLLRTVEWLGMVALFLAYTKGPIFWVRLELDPPLTGDFIDDTRVQIAFVVAAVPTIIGGVLAVRSVRRDPWFVAAWL